MRFLSDFVSSYKMFVKIAQSIAELWPIKTFYNVRPITTLCLKGLSFGCRIFVVVLIYFSLQNFIIDNI